MYRHGLELRSKIEVRSLLGRAVATRTAQGMYAQYRTVKAADCLVLPEGTSPRDGASAFINPLTVLGMVARGPLLTCGRFPHPRLCRLYHQQ
jgi:NADPH:quinone reductase